MIRALRRGDRDKRAGRTPVLVAAPVFLALLLSFSAPGGASTDLSGIGRYVRAEMEINRIPGLSLAIVRNGRVLYTGAYGISDLATGAPMTAETLVDLASVSKTFTGLAIWRLREGGKLELDAPVGKYFPEHPAGRPDALEGVTVRHLLRHRSGFTRRGDYLAPCCGAPEQADLALAVRRIREARRPRPPGSPFRYANRNYVVLAALIEQVSGQPFPDYMQANVFVPLGMERTTLDLARAREWGMAAYHERQWGRVRPSPSEFSGWYGSSGIKSTASDMARYALAILNSQQSGIGRFLRSASATASPNETLYEMGWFITPAAEWLNGATVWRHTGDIWGANAALFLAPDLGAGVAVLANLGAHRAGEIARGVLGRVLGLSAPPPQRALWGQIPDNWAILSCVGAALTLLWVGWHLTAVRKQFQRGERGFRWDSDWLALLRAALLTAMAAYLVGLVFAGGAPLAAFPTTMRTALPLLTAAMVAVLAVNAVLSFAPRRKR